MSSNANKDDILSGDDEGSKDMLTNSIQISGSKISHRTAAIIAESSPPENKTWMDYDFNSGILCTLNWQA